MSALESDANERIFPSPGQFCSWGRQLWKPCLNDVTGNGYYVVTDNAVKQFLLGGRRLNRADASARNQCRAQRRSAIQSIRVSFMMCSIGSIYPQYGLSNEEVANHLFNV